jgi:hypothetical protein
MLYMSYIPWASSVFTFQLVRLCQAVRECRECQAVRFSLTIKNAYILFHHGNLDDWYLFNQKFDLWYFYIFIFLATRPSEQDQSFTFLTSLDIEHWNLNETSHMFLKRFMTVSISYFVFRTSTDVSSLFHDSFNHLLCVSNFHRCFWFVSWQFQSVSWII